MLGKIKTMNLMKKGILFVVVFIFVPALIIFWAASNQAALAIKQQVGKALSELNKQNHATIDRVMDAIDQNTVKLMSSNLIQQWNKPLTIPEEQRVKQYVATEKLLAEYSSKEQYSLFLLEQNVADYYFAPPTDISDSGVFFLDHEEGKDGLTDALAAGGIGIIRPIEQLGFTITSQQTLAYLRAVSDLTASGKPKNVIAATGMETVIQEALNGINLPKNSRKFLVDHNGVVLAGGHSEFRSFVLPEQGEELLPHVWITNSHMYVYHDSPLYLNRLVYEIPLKAVLGAHTAMQDIIKITALCYFAFILLCLLYFGKSIIRPMARLATFTRMYEPGQQMDRFKEGERKDEIGVFYNSFYAMTERLNQLVQEKYVMEIKQKESELILLHSQITPHLLYNTLDSVYWYGIRGGVPEVAEMVRDLSTVLRIGLSRGKELIHVREEREHVEAYLHLQEKRYDHSFQFSIVVDSAVEHCLLPKVIIQPLVENSILHGVGKMDGEGEVYVRIKEAADEVRILVEDNGFRPVDLKKLESNLSSKADADQGFGIRNVNKRIQLRFGPSYGLFYELREEGGLRAIIRLPKLYKLEELEQLVYTQQGKEKPVQVSKFHTT
ncbi:sensor histidine kinase [Paenibacillus agaridevorans]|uniref:Sensor histidine kinase n=1 Tax=Paenibacillus agaridevorans TaxID=171404 RepID=A0A2R5EMR6_9BACL|nr:sensor histidine kinase [Paenibacillus agaridevorans]GBG06268.1 sensor histidine kinase [Paenibacillus agaridevorans]